MTASTVFFLLLVLACPVAMWVMMRGGHGHGADHGSHAGRGHGCPAEDREQAALIDEVRRQREELDRLIEERELSELEQPERELTPSGWNR